MRGFLALLLVVTFQSTFALIWKTSIDAVWAHQCDFVAKDIGSAVVPPEKCSEACGRNNNCTHFVWTQYQGGTCWLKSNPKVTKSDAIESTETGAVCGMLTKKLKGIFLSETKYICTFRDACTSLPISVLKNETMIDGCKKVYNVSKDCTAKLIGSTAEMNATEFCALTDACWKIRISGLRNRTIIDGCKNVYKISSTCKLMLVGKTEELTSEILPSLKKGTLPSRKTPPEKGTPVPSEKSKSASTQKGSGFALELQGVESDIVLAIVESFFAVTSIFLLGRVASISSRRKARQISQYGFTTHSAHDFEDPLLTTVQLRGLRSWSISKVRNLIINATILVLGATVLLGTDDVECKSNNIRNVRSSLQPTSCAGGEGINRYTLALLLSLNIAREIYRRKINARLIPRHFSLGHEDYLGDVAYSPDEIENTVVSVTEEAGMMSYETVKNYFPGKVSFTPKVNQSSSPNQPGPRSVVKKYPFGYLSDFNHSQGVLLAFDSGWNGTHFEFLAAVSNLTMTINGAGSNIQSRVIRIALEKRAFQVLSVADVFSRFMKAEFDLQRAIEASWMAASISEASFFPKKCVRQFKKEKKCTRIGANTLVTLIIIVTVTLLLTIYAWTVQSAISHELTSPFSLIHQAITGKHDAFHWDQTKLESQAIVQGTVLDSGQGVGKLLVTSASSGTLFEVLPPEVLSLQSNVPVHERATNIWSSTPEAENT